VTPPNS